MTGAGHGVNGSPQGVSIALLVLARQVLQWLRFHGEGNSAQIGRRFGCSAGSIRRALNILRHMGAPIRFRRDFRTWVLDDATWRPDWDAYLGEFELRRTRSRLTVLGPDSGYADIEVARIPIE